MTRTVESVVSDALAGFTEGPGNNVRLWPRDEAQAYRDNGGFQAGHDAANAIRLSKAAARVAEALLAAGMVIAPAGSGDQAQP